MGKLALAGMVSGAGQGLERGLQQLQGGLIQAGLASDERTFLEKKLQLQMDHAERLQRGSQAFQRAEKAEDRALSKDQFAQKEASDTARHQQTLGTQVVTAGMTNERIREEGALERTSREGIAKEERLSRGQIAQLTADANERIHDATNKTSRYVADQNMQAALLKSYSDAQNALRTEINRLSIIATDYKMDPNNPEFKSALKELDAARRELWGLSSARDMLQKKLESEHGVARPDVVPPSSKFKIPTDLGSSTAPTEQSAAPSAASPSASTSNSLVDAASRGYFPLMRGLVDTLRKK